MIVVGIIGLILVIAIPNYLKSRNSAQKNACITNLQQIEKCKSLWALENKKNTGDNCTMNDLVPQYIKVEPKCPSGTASYSVNGLGSSPTCPNYQANDPYLQLHILQ